MLKPRSLAGAMPRRHHAGSVTLTFAHQLAIPVLGHPSGTRKVRVVDPATALRIVLWVEAKQDLNGFLPVGAITRRVEQPQIENHMLAIIRGQPLT